MWLIVLRTIGWVYAAMFRPLILTTAWVYAVLWVMLGPLNILLTLMVPAVKFSLTETGLHVVQFALGLYLMRYLCRSSWSSRQETVRLGESDA